MLIPERLRKMKSIDYLFGEHKTRILLDYLSSKIEFDFPGQLSVIISLGPAKGIEWLQQFFKAGTSVKIRVASLQFTVSFNPNDVTISLNDSLFHSRSWHDVWNQFNHKLKCGCWNKL